MRRAIVDKHVYVPPGFAIGWNREQDLARGFTVTPEGVTVVSKDEDLERFV
jgi:glucose-1-phosphate adenylyltransferase